MRKLIVLTLVAVTLALPALADNRGRGNGRGHDKHSEETRGNRDETPTLTIDRDLNISFSTRELNVITDWFDTQPVAARQGRGLPPGLAKQLRERGHLPPGLEAKGLPPGLAEKLGAPPRGYDHVIIGNDVALINLATGVIADIIRSVL